MKFKERIILLESCESTNDVAMELARRGCEHGTAIIARQQTKGKGRLGRSWESFSGNLAMSLVVRPTNLPMKQASRLVMLSAYAVKVALKDYGILALIKWPNDILIRSADGQAAAPKLGTLRKLGGILLEMRSANDMVDAAVIGVGLNLQEPSAEEKEKVTLQMGFVNIEVEKFSHHLLNRLEESLAKPEDDAFFAHILSDVEQHLAFRNEDVVIDKGGEFVSGKVLGLASDGALLLESEKGAKEHVYYGDLSLAAT